MYCVLIGTDQHGSFPYLLRPDDSLPGSERGIGWRMVAESDDCELAMAVLELMHKRYGELGLV